MKIIFVGIYAINFFIFPSVVLAQGKYTEIENTKIYSEYYPAAQSKFKGTIVFENGSGTPLSEWTENKDFFQCVKPYGNLFVYDRNSLGKSLPDLSMSLDKPLTAKLVNFKLMQLLNKNSIKPPYILVAHSYGGMYAGYFARRYPALVKGVLMVDPVPSSYEWSDAFIKIHNTEIEKMSKLSSQEVYKQFNSSKGNTSPELFYQLIGFVETKKQVNSLPPIDKNIPIIILTSSYMEKNAPVEGDWYLQQKEWLNENTDSKIIRVQSSHFIQLDQPKVVCEQIKVLVDLVTAKGSDAA